MIYDYCNAKNQMRTLCFSLHCVKARKERERERESSRGSETEHEQKRQYREQTIPLTRASNSGRLSKNEGNSNLFLVEFSLFHDRIQMFSCANNNWHFVNYERCWSANTAETEKNRPEIQKEKKNQQHHQHQQQAEKEANTRTSKEAKCNTHYNNAIGNMLDEIPTSQTTKEHFPRCFFELEHVFAFHSKLFCIFMILPTAQQNLLLRNMFYC